MYSLYSGILISLIFDLFVELGHQYGGDGGDGCQSHGGGDIDQCHDRHRIENDDQWWVENVQWERHANNIVASKSQWSNKWRNIFYFLSNIFIEQHFDSLVVFLLTLFVVSLSKQRTFLSVVLLVVCCSCSRVCDLGVPVAALCNRPPSQSIPIRAS